MLNRILCALGLHGPNVLGNYPSRRSSRTAGLERTCEFCDSVWYGRPADVRGTRSAIWRPATDWCERCGADVYLDGKCCAHGCGHLKGAAIAKAEGQS